MKVKRIDYKLEKGKVVPAPPKDVEVDIKDLRPGWTYLMYKDHLVAAYKGKVFPDDPKEKAKIQKLIVEDRQQPFVLIVPVPPPPPPEPPPKK